MTLQKQDAEFYSRPRDWTCGGDLDERVRALCLNARQNGGAIGKNSEVQR